MPWKHWNSDRIGVALAVLAAFGFSFKAIFVKLAYAAAPVDAVTLLSLRMVFSLPAFLWIGFTAGGVPQQASLIAVGFAAAWLALSLAYFALRK